MKKLKLNNLKLEVNDMLQREQLKTILGGGHGGYSPPENGDGWCDDWCSPGLPCTAANGGSGNCEQFPCLGTYNYRCMPDWGGGI